MYRKYKNGLTSADMSKSKSNNKVMDYIDLPTERIKHQSGISLDFGGSVMKIIYRPKDGTQAKPNEKPVAKGFERIRFAWFSREDFDDALKFIEDNCSIRRNGDTETCIFVTGFGANSSGKDIADRLKLKLVTLPEQDCFAKAFNYLVTTLPKSQIIDPPNEDGAKDGQKFIDTFMSYMEKIEEHGIDDHGFKVERPKDQEVNNEESSLPMSTDTKDMFPCIVLMLGSGFGIFKVEADGKFEVLDTINRGGRSFLGLGNILTGTKSYEDLISLAELGSDKGVSEYTSEIFGTEAEEVDEEAEVNAYNLLDDTFDMIVYTFGKACFQTIDDLKPEDIARGHVIQYAVDISQKAHLSALFEKAKHVFFGGNFANPTVMRRELTKANIERSVTPLAIGLPPVDFHFMTHGGQLAALGAFLHQP